MEPNYVDKISLREQLVRDQKLIFKAKPEEKYRGPYPGEGITFQQTDFMNFKVVQKSCSKYIKLKTYLFLPDEDKFKSPVAVLFMFHGMGSHSEPSAFMAKQFSEHGIVVAAYDYRGHGYSEGEPGNIENMDEVIEDSEMFIQLTLSYLKRRYSKSNECTCNFLNNKFLMGLSMGGFISYFISKANPSEYKGVLFYAPALATWPGGFFKCIIKMLGCIFPCCFLPKWNRESIIVKNPHIFENPDPVHDRTYIKFRTISELERKLQIIEKGSHTYYCPFVIVCAGKDKLVKPIGLLNFFENSNSPDKDFWYYPNLWHGVYFEEEIYEIMERSIKWIIDRVSC